MADEIEQVSSEVVYRNRWMTVREDRVRRADGSDGIYGLIEKHDYSLIVPFDGARLHLVQQYRYPVGGRFWEFPQGMWEDRADATPHEVAAGELAEETGLRAATWTPLGRFFQAYGYSGQAVNVYLATDLTPGERSLEPEEHGLVNGTFSVGEVRTMLGDGSIGDITCVAAAHLFFDWLGRS